MNDSLLLDPISNPQFIDAIDASLELPINERSKVIVRGEQIQEGVVLASSLEVDGVQQIFLPTGFFTELAKKVLSIINREGEIEIIEAKI